MKRTETHTLWIDEFAWPEEIAAVEVVIRSALITAAKVGQCRFCLHAESDHQKGGETVRSGLHFKPGVLSTGDKAPWLGTNRYCHEALCSCTHYHHAHCACPSRLVACTYVPGGPHGV